MSEHLVFVWRTTGYELREREGDLPAVGDEIEDDGKTAVVAKIGPSPLPRDPRVCVYLGE
jgi:hypothetical protein